jgi:hypothetical protein
MAIFIPETLPTDYELRRQNFRPISRAERRFFEELVHMRRELPGWVVIHSVRLRLVEGQAQGECDFVIIVPEKGWLSIEVKGGNVYCEDGQYFSEALNNETHRISNPFTQADNARWALHRYLGEKFPQYSSELRVLHSFGVYLPDTPTFPGGVSDCKARAYTGESYRTNRPLKKFLGESLFSVQEEALRRAAREQNRRYTVSEKPHLDTIANIKNSFTGDYFQPGGMEQLMEIDRQIDRATLDQQEFVQYFLEDNERIMVRGPAGSGKTLLALYSAKTFVQKGLKVLFLCFNKKLQQKLEELIGGWRSEEKELIRLYTIDGLIHQILVKAGPEYFDLNERELDFEERAYKAARVDEEVRSVFLFDQLIVDEAQDVLRDHFYDMLNQFINGGWNSGRWILFLDVNQNLFADHQDLQDLISILEGQCARHRLRKLVRNTTNIGHQVLNLGDLNPESFGLSGVSGSNLNLLTIDASSESNQLLSLLEQLRQQNKINQSVILSFRKFHDSVACRFNEEQDTFMVLGGNQEPKRGRVNLQFHTIHSFKGLESDVVILCDLGDAPDKRLLYVGLSRAKAEAHILGMRSVFQELRLI